MHRTDNIFAQLSRVIAITNTMVKTGNKISFGVRNKSTYLIS